MIGKTPPALAQSALDYAYDFLFTTSSNQKHIPEFGSTAFGHVAEILLSVIYVREV